jgi:hypothetical protein
LSIIGTFSQSVAVIDINDSGMSQVGVIFNFLFILVKKVSIMEKISPGPDNLQQLRKALEDRDFALFLPTLSNINHQFSLIRPLACPPEACISLLKRCYENLIQPNLHKLAVPADKTWTEEVYGELRPSFLQQIFCDAQLTSNSIFLDLGSGVGHTIVQAATTVGCRAIGIEKRKVAATLADTFVEEIQKRGLLWKIQLGSMEVMLGDMLQSKAVLNLIKEADLILANNEIFPEQCECLKLI